MGIHLTEHARRHGVEKFVRIGTGCSYPKHASGSFREGLERTIAWYRERRAAGGG